MLTFLGIMAAVIGVVTYLCLCVKAGFIVSDLTENTGFDAGFYMITVFTLLALPVAVLVGFSQ